MVINELNLCVDLHDDPVLIREYEPLHPKIWPAYFKSIQLPAITTGNIQARHPADDDPRSK